jgi:ATP synthase I chain
MSDAKEPFETVDDTVQPITHRRILSVMAICVIVGTILSFVFGSWQFGLGFLIGGILSFINYYWLKISLKKVFDSAEADEKPRISATKYMLRYVVFGGLLVLIYLTKTVPVAAVILGLASFAFAILIEAFIRIFSSFFNKKDI